MEQQKILKSNTNDHLANERTLLAWVRTSIGILAFGFVLVKSPGFVQTEKGISLGPNGDIYSFVIGSMLVIVASVSLIFAYIGYRRTGKQINSGNFQQSPVFLLMLILILFTVSIILLIYLLQGYFSKP